MAKSDLKKFDFTPLDSTKLSSNSFINNDLRVFWFLELLERLLGRYKSLLVGLDMLN